MNEYLPMIFSALGAAVTVGIPALVALKTTESRSDRKYTRREELIQLRTEAIMARQETDVRECRKELQEARHELEAKIDKYEGRVAELQMILIREGRGAAIPRE